MESENRMCNLESKESVAGVEQYFREIYRKPYKMEVKLYMAVILLSLLGIVASYFVPYKFESMQDSNWMDLLKNISFGCFTSTLVSAWIEKANIKGSNDKNNKMYHEIYLELQFSIRSYVESWSRIYYVIFREEDVKTEKHTWIEWYNVTRDSIGKCSKQRQKQAMKFVFESLQRSVKEVNSSIQKILDNKNLLITFDLYDRKLEDIIMDYKFEFDAAQLELERFSENKDIEEYKEFWIHFDAIRDDLIHYIENWYDIKYYNYIEFAPTGHMESCDLMKAIALSVKQD